MTALALGDEHPPLTQAQVAKSEPEDLATPEASQDHRLDHGPVALGAQLAEERIDVIGVEDPRQAPHAAHERQPLARAPTALARRQCPGAPGWR